MKNSISLLALLGPIFFLQACMTAQDKLNWEQTVAWYKGEDLAVASAEKSEDPKAEAAPSIEAKVIDDANSAEAPQAK